MWQIKVYSTQGSLVGRFAFEPPYKRKGNSLILREKFFSFKIEKKCTLKFFEIQDDYGLVVARIPIRVGPNKIKDNTLFLESIDFVPGQPLGFTEFFYSPTIQYDPEEEDQELDYLE